MVGGPMRKMRWIVSLETELYKGLQWYEYDSWILEERSDSYGIL